MADAVGDWTQREDANGYAFIEPDVATMVRRSGIPRDELALAAMIASEIGGLPRVYGLAVADVALNEAKAKGISVADLLTTPVKGLHAGSFGEQSGRYASTRQRPAAKHFEMARAALSSARGLTRGARRFTDNAVQDRGIQRGKPLAHDAVSLLKSRYGDGWRWIGPLEGIDPYKLMLMAKEGKPIESALDVIMRGRAGLSTAALAGGGVALLFAAGVAFAWWKGLI